MMKREAFGQIYVRLALELRLGRSIFVSDSANSRRNTGVATSSTSAPTRRRPNLGNNGRSPETSNRAFGNSLSEAQAVLSDAVRLAKQNQIDQAAVKFEDAIRLAPDLQFRAQAYEAGMLVFAAKGKLREIVYGYVDITQELQGSEAIQKASDEFFRTIIKYLNRNSIDASGTRRTWSRISWNIRDHSVPISVSNMISSAFEDQLNKIPLHEPSLKILQTLYRDVSKNSKQHYSVLLQLEQIYTDRGEKQDYNSLRSLADLHLSNGAPAKAALIFQGWNQNARSSDRFRSGWIDEANAWARANEKKKALKVLRTAELDLTRRKTKISSLNLRRMIDLFTRLEITDKSVPLIKHALKYADSKYETDKLQEMLKTTLANTEMGETGSGSAEEAEALLDPKQGFRAEARDYENRRSGSPSSRASNLIRAASNWQKAEEMTKRFKALSNAAKELRKIPNDRSIDSYYQRIADQYVALEVDQKALDFYLLALSESDSEHEMKSLHGKVMALTEENNSLKIPPKMRELADPLFAARQSAKIEEEKAKKHLQFWWCQ